MTDQFKSKMRCPACKELTKRTRNGECVHCRVPLELFTYIRDGKNYREFRIKEPERAAEVVQAAQSAAPMPDVGGRMLTPVGSNPEIVMTSSKPRRYKVTYRQTIPTDWVYCPDCQNRLFQNRILNSVYLDMEFTCPHCFAETTFYFITDFSHVGR